MNGCHTQGIHSSVNVTDDEEKERTGGRRRRRAAAQWEPFPYCLPFDMFVTLSDAMDSLYCHCNYCFDGYGRGAPGFEEASLSLFLSG